MPVIAPDHRRTAVLELARRYTWDERHSRQVARLALGFFDQAAELHGLGGDDRDLLECGALLHDIGGHVSADDHHKHTAYLIENSRLRGFGPDEIAMLACLGRFHRRGELKPGYAPYRLLPPDHRDRVAVLVALLRLADGLDRSHRQVVDGADLVVDDGRASLRFEARGDAELELWSSRRKAELFETVFACRLSVEVKRSRRLAAV